ncbi:FISUMP domain-containing protein [Aquirufa antheringensis]
MQFEEVHKTKTDNYGLVNLLIGSVSSTSFNSLVWDSSQKSLQVYVSFDQGSSYTKISDQKLNYNPYALFAETAGKLSGVLPVANGGTGATTAADARANLGLDQVNNTSDAAKPVSTATQAALALKANTADMTAALAAKADTGTIKAYVDTKIGSNNNTSNQSSSSNISNAALAAKADTSFVLAQVAAATIVDADATTKGKIQLAGDLAGTAAAPAVPGLALKANVTDLVTLTSTVNANTASITANTNAITLKAPIASPVFTGTVAIGTANPSAGAVLDITSTSKGLLLPRLTFAQKSAIVSPEAGLILWCSDCGTNGELQVYNGTNFVNMVGANAQFALPSVTSTASATSITSSALTSGGVIDADGGAFVTIRGVVWNTSTNPTISLSTKTTDGTGIGTFSSAITGLTSGVTYYVRAYATNSVGTKYGPEISVNTAQSVATLASTTSASSIGANTATSGGNITYNGGATVTVSGLVWSTSANPTTSDNKTTNGAANGSFTSNITGLTPGTLYYVRSYATNSVGTSYGAQTSFTTLNTASISATTSVTSITSTSATSGGTITTDGGAAVSARGIVWGTSTGSSTFSVTTGSGTGTFVSNLTGLSPATTYFVRSFATNSVGTVYGTETSFTTIAIAPTLTTTAASSITRYAAISGVSINSNGGSAITASGICWSTTATPTVSDNKTTDGTLSGTFTSSITGLTAGTTYYVRAYATNAIGTGYGDAQSFTTSSPALILPTIGSSYGGGKVAYVYQNGDPGYSSSSIPVLIAANADQVGNLSGGTALWSITGGSGVAQKVGLIGSSFEALGAGLSNTNAIISAYGTGNYAAKFARDYTDGTYNDWYMPSINELGKLYLNRVAIGGFSTQYYWSSTEVQESSTQISGYSWSFNGSGNDKHMDTKAWNMKIRAVRTTTIVPSTSSAPIVAATTSAASITSSSAILGGNVTDEGSTEVSVRGLVYGTSTGSSNFSVTVGSGAGTFTSTLTGLTQGATYFVRSFATNVQGTSYGAETSFTTQTAATLSATATPTSITTTSAISGGTISSTGGATITTSGLVWGANANPEITLATKTTDGTTSGTFTSSITGLTQGTTYHVRAYATNYLGTSYGPDVTFTTIATPTISGTSSATSITSSTATAGGTITSDGGASVTSRGLVFGTSSGASTFSVTTGTGTGTYTSSLTGLSPATTYFVRSFATNSVGTVYGTETSFTTIAIAPTLTTTAASSNTKYAASAGGTITSNGGSTITASGICWSTTATPTTANSKTTDGTTSGTFTSSITGLTAGTVYYVRAYATNAIGTSYGAAQSFTTLSTPVAQTSVLIGTQRWTDKNLNVANYRNGDAITYAANSAQWAAATSAGEGAYTYLKYASGDGGATYGKLYNWYAVNDARGLAPAGYHIPTLSEWTTLRSSQNLNGTTLKSNTTDWSGEFSNVNNNISVTPNANYNLYNGTNSTGFNVLPGGSIFNTGTNGNYGSASFWTATQDATNPTRAEWLYFHPSFFYVGSDCCATENKQTGMSIRLVKDNNLVESSPTTPILASTTSATSITANSAILGGNVTDEGATQVSVRGLVYGTSAGSSTFSVTIGSGAGTFTSTLTGLTQGATYFVRSFATNVQGTTYGAETSFTTQTTPTVSATSAPTSVGTTTAIGGGTIGSTGGATITTSGLVWDLAINPTIALSTKTTNGATSGTFTSTMTGLTQGTTYHVRAYATNYLGTSYGPDITFTTLTTPTVSATATISSITGTTATGGGTITADGGASVTSRGVVYGTSSGSSTYSSTSGTGTGAYVSSLTGLIPATTYYVRAFATNSVGTVFGPEISFSSSASAPILSTTAASSITKVDAVSGGTITANGGSAITSSGICWSTSAMPTIANSKTTDGTTSGTFTSSMTGLALGTTYYVRAYATNAIGTGYGAAQSFTTMPFENVPTAANPVTNGLMLYLDATRTASYSSSGSGNTWADISGLSPAGNATLVGSPVFGSSSLANGSGSFTFGSNIYASTSKTYTIDNEITYIAWINPSQSFDGAVINRRTDPSFQSGATSLYIVNGNLCYDWDNSKYGWRSNLMVPNNQWSMVVISVNAGSVTAYLCNASGISNATNGTTHDSLTSKGATKFNIGYDPYNTAARALRGKIGTAMVYSVALTSADITAIFNAQKASFGL